VKAALRKIHSVKQISCIFARGNVSMKQAYPDTKVSVTN